MAKKQPDDPLEATHYFVEQVRKRNDPRVYVGIDPGATGAIALLGRDCCAVLDIPTIALAVKRTKRTTDEEFVETGKLTKRIDGKTTRFDFHSICALFSELQVIRGRIMIGLEAVPSSLGPGRRHAENMLNRAYAMWPLFLFSHNYSVIEVTPSVWKAAFGLAGKGRNDKGAARLRAASMFPTADLGRVKDHNRAEALLIAEYTRRQHSGSTG